MIHRRSYALLALLLLIGVGTLHARVFWRSPTRRGAVEPQSLAWREAFSGEIEMDGEPYGVQVLAARSGGPGSLSQLESYFERRGARFSGAAGGELGWGLAEWDGRRAQILIVSPAALRRALVFVFSSGSDPRVAPQPVIADLPRYPGARLRRSAARAESGMQLEFLETHASEAELLDFYERALGRAGWSPLLRDRHGRALPRSALFFMKNGRFCCISVKSAGTGRGNLITVLVKD
jgi:hypothetical protein